MSTEHQVESESRATPREQAAAQSPTTEIALQGDAGVALQLARAHPDVLRPSSILALQQTAGNTAVSRLLSRPPSNGPGNEAGQGLLGIQRKIGDKAGQKGFSTAGEAREADFLKLAANKGVAPNVATELYLAARTDVTADVVTGFDLAGDRKPTVERALAHIKQNPTVGAYYVEVDVKNLGGLNAALGHQKADEVYGQMARIAEEKMMGLPAKVGRFRHGGDEFSFVVVGEQVTKATIEHALTEANSAIATYLQAQKLTGVGHPKHPTDEKKKGAGIVYGISTMLHDDDVNSVLSAAALRVEAKKVT